MGCAVKFGKMISDEKEDLYMICIMLIAPLYICYVMAGKVKKYWTIVRFSFFLDIDRINLSTLFAFIINLKSMKKMKKKIRVIESR